MESTAKEATSFLRKIVKINPKRALILGSGLGDFADTLADKIKISTENIPNFPKSTVYGHPGFLVWGFHKTIPVVALQGRTHFYEGYSLGEITFIIQIFKILNIKLLIITNAAGAINPRLKPGDLMLITDHVHFMFASPLLGRPGGSGRELTDLSNAYAKEYFNPIESLALERKIALKRGTLWTTTGPTYESSAEVKMIQKLGGDAGSMSTSPEVIAAAQADIPVIGISCITNYATGISPQKLDHHEVTRTANRIKEKFMTLISGILTELS